uniref:Cytochrome b5 heme-binding domain-containing protein n=1 Tax=viral metagenome TaxID=1070528 RepID=A0A6C0D075_9ZZZZ
MWSIYGNTYDLTSFIPHHPGGKEILENTRNMGDCTALFESYHAFSDFPQIRQSLEKYKIQNHLTEGKKDYCHDFTTYHELVDRIKLVFPDRPSIKPSSFWYTLVSGLGIAYVFILYHLLSYELYGFWTTLYLSGVMGLLESTILFNIVHDSSHYAFFLDSKKNNVASTLSNSWILWNHTVWFFHHIFYHHSFTGNFIDPDHNIFNNLRNVPSWMVNFFYMVFPGQYVTQIIWYGVSVFTHDLYTFFSFNDNRQVNGEPIVPLPSRGFSYFYDPWSLSIMSIKIVLLSRIPIVPLLFYFIVVNVLYYGNVFGNHDLYSTLENFYDGPDWAKRQICNSGNFMNSSVIWSFLFGGINYQIEHHLFPNMNNSHYRTIAPLVQQFCLEKNIPYIHKNTWLETYSDFIKRTKHRKH